MEKTLEQILRELQEMEHAAALEKLKELYKDGTICRDEYRFLFDELTTTPERRNAGN